jgi:hypothetical protein
MFGEHGRRRGLVALAVLVCGGALTSAVVASHFDDGSDLADAIGAAPLVRVADVPSGDGVATKGIFAQRTATGHLCVWEASSTTSRDRGGGCNPIDEPLGGRAMSFTLSYDGGPATVDVRSASLFGLALEDVAAIRVLMSDGSAREVRLKRAKVASDEFQAFGYRFRRADLRKAIGPVAVVALDASGTEIDRQTTGIG